MHWKLDVGSFYGVAQWHDLELRKMTFKISNFCRNVCNGLQTTLWQWFKRLHDRPIRVSRSVKRSKPWEVFPLIATSNMTFNIKDGGRHPRCLYLIWCNTHGRHYRWLAHTHTRETSTSMSTFSDTTYWNNSRPTPADADRNRKC